MSFKLTDKIKKSNMPATLKRVFEGYVSFGNSDGTSIRPTERAVGKRASCSRQTRFTAHRGIGEVGIPDPRA